MSPLPCPLSLATGLRPLDFFAAMKALNAGLKGAEDGLASAVLQINGNPKATRTRRAIQGG
jgi:hypothetical protein